MTDFEQLFLKKLKLIIRVEEISLTADVTEIITFSSDSAVIEAIIRDGTLFANDSSQTC